MNEYQEVLNVYSCLEHENTIGEYTPLEYQKARMKLLELVKKESPKKPIKRYYIECGYHDYKKRVDIKCPCCNSSFTNGVRNSIGIYASREKKFIETIKKIKYCGFCGKAIDWGYEE